ncbi:MAG: hypothetical protein CVV52_13600, partial [Spirochaetae bacterium HGW-Spirochaetae-8]
ADLEKEKLIVASYQNYYKSQDRLIVRTIRRLLRYSLILLLVSLGFMILNVILSSYPSTQIFPMIVSEGVRIASWVFMWEAFHSAFMQSLDPLKRRREFSRFLRAGISFRLVGQVLNAESDAKENDPNGERFE